MTKLHHLASLRSLLLSLLLLSLLLTLPAAAQVATLVPDRDNTLYLDVNGNLSNGAGDHFFAGVTVANETRRGVLHFDIAGAVPAGALITSAALTLHMSRSVNAGTETFTLHRLTSDWGEGTSDATGQEGGGADATTDDATWLHTFFPNGLWTTAGGDFDPAISAATSVDMALGFYTWGSSNEMVADVQSWLDDPASNYGWILAGNEDSTGTSKRFDTRENPEPDQHPLLVIEYRERCIINAALGQDVIPAGGYLDVDLYLQHNRPATVNRAFYVHIEDDQGRVRWQRETQQHTLGYQDTVQRSLALALPAGMQPGAYTLVFGMEGMTQGHAVARQPFTVAAAGTTPVGKGGPVLAEPLEGAWTAVDGPDDVPATFALEQNYPNPFNPTTRITYALPEEAHVRLVVYNVLGQEVARLVDGRTPAGTHHARLDASRLSAGLYLYTLEADGFTATRRMTLLK